ncbi:MAG TPA: rhomboid family intramembrane serine protease [Gammaproteobacteria bacterium]|nr:rhomboid family intramembrane serine protease [Gammaproteobacteria bacterium]
MDADALIDVVVCRDREECSELALVLAAQAIPARARGDGRSWVLSVPADSLARARLEIEAYRTESKLSRTARPAVPAEGRPWPGISLFTAALLLMGLLAPAMRFDVDWLTLGRMDGGRMLAGDWWRPVTALTLHADSAHLLGNIGFGAFFAYSVTRYLGAGFGWLAIVATGALGNVANGLLAGPDHRSIGASTAVFAALGLLTAYLWRRGFRSDASRRERIAPIAAGIGLLAFTGAGGVDTDIGAHLLGFVAGFAGGLVVARTGFPMARTVRTLSACAAGAIVAVAWAIAIALG